MKKQFFRMNYFVLLAIIIVGIVIWEQQKSNQIRTATSEMFEIIDGDTVYFEGKKARLLGFDAAEMEYGSGRAGRAMPFIDAQEPWGSEAKDKLQQLINSSEQLEVAIADQKDKYNRSLIHIYVNGVPVAVSMIEAGLAYETISQYGDNGFPKEARLILKAASESETPEFENPDAWGRRNEL